MDSINIQPPFFGRRQPDYPPLLQLLRVTAATVVHSTGASQVAGSSILAGALYVSFTEQLRTDTLLPVDREPCLVLDVNGTGLTAGFYLGRLAGSFNSLPLYEVGGAGSSAGSGPSFGSAILTTNYGVGTTFGNTALSVTLPSAGTYLLTADVLGDISSTLGFNAVLQAQLYDQTAGAAVPNSISVAAYWPPIVASYDLLSSCSINVLYTVTQATTIYLQGRLDPNYHTTSVTGTILANAYIAGFEPAGTRLSYVQLTAPSGGGGGGGGSGTVTSVGITGPQGITWLGSPVTTSGTFAATWTGQIPMSALPSPQIVAAYYNHY